MTELIIGSIVLVVVAIVLIRYLMSKSNINTWQPVSEHYGLELKDAKTNPSLSGTYQGRWIKVDCESVGDNPNSMKGSITNINFRVGLNHQLPANIFYGRKGIFDRQSPIQTGNKDFDKKIFVDGCSQSNAQNYLSDDKQKLILKEVGKMILVSGKSDQFDAHVYKQELYSGGSKWAFKHMNQLLDLAVRLDA